MPVASIGIEAARGRLGEIVDQVARSGNAVVLTKRGEQRAVLVSGAEYERLKSAGTRAARQELRERLNAIREQVAQARLDPSVVDQAVAAARRAR